MKFMKRVVILILVMILVIPSTITMPAKAVSKNIKIGEYVELLMKAMNITINESEEQPYITAAVGTSVFKTADEFDVNKELTRAECAVLTNRADVYINGNKERGVYENIVNLKRISDLSKIKKSYRDDVVQVFGKGIIVGYTNGKYSQSRAFRGNSKITYQGAKVIVSKLMNKKDRKKISPDGQLIRTTNLPKNYKAYDYILEAFPNSFYEMKFAFQYGIKQVWDKKKDGWVTVDKVELEDYARPCKIREWSEEKKQAIDLYLYDWCSMVEQNLKYRFNVDYRTVGNEWFKGIRETYAITGNENIDKEYTDEIKEYIKSVKKNKIIIKAEKVVVEPSTFYKDTLDNFRCYVKFKIISCNNMKIDANEIIFSNFNNIKLRKGIWIERYFDMDIAPSYGSLNYLDAAQSTKIGNNNLLERKDGVVKN
jgi:hypothetical protein